MCAYYVYHKKRVLNGATCEILYINMIFSNAGYFLKSYAFLKKTHLTFASVV